MKQRRGWSEKKKKKRLVTFLPPRITTKQQLTGY